MTRALLLAALFCAGTASAEEKLDSKLPARSAPLPRLKAGPRSPGAMNLKVSFKVRNRGLESSGNFLIQAGAQVNYVVGGDAPFDVEAAGGRGIEFKKYGTIVNILATVKGDKADVQCQIEQTGPLEPVGTLRARPIETFQLQTEFTAELGRPAVIVDEPGRRVEFLIEEAS